MRVALQNVFAVVLLPAPKSDAGANEESFARGTECGWVRFALGGAGW